MIRNTIFADLDKLQEWCPKEYPPPDLTSGLYCVQKSLLGEDGEVAGFALLKLTCEAVLVLDPDANELERARMVKVAFEKLKSEATEKYGLDQVHIFILPENNISYAELLKKHFGFQETTGIPLVYTR